METLTEMFDRMITGAYSIGRPKGETSMRARLQDAKVVAPHDMPATKRHLDDKLVMCGPYRFATGGVIKDVTMTCADGRKVHGDLYIDIRV